MVWLVVAALVAGVLGGMGMGGGTVYIPILTMGFGVPQHLAQWLNLVGFVPMAILSVVIHAKHRLLDKTGIWLLIPSAVSCVIFSLLAVRVVADLLRIIFAGFLVMTGLSGIGITVAKMVKTKKRNTPREPQDLPDGA